MMRQKFDKLESLEESMHDKMMDLFRKYLLVGGMPDAVNAYVQDKTSGQSEKSSQKFMNIMLRMLQSMKLIGD